MVNSGDIIKLKPLRLNGSVYKMKLSEPNEYSPKNTFFEGEIIEIVERPETEKDPVMSVGESFPLARDDIENSELVQD